MLISCLLTPGVAGNNLLADDDTAVASVPSQRWYAERHCLTPLLHTTWICNQLLDEPTATDDVGGSRRASDITYPRKADGTRDSVTLPTL